VVIVQGGAYPIRIAIHFEGGRLAKDSKPLLTEVARVLQGNPQILRVAVQGHASADERDPQRKGLQRAQAVVDELVALGVARERLVAESYGAEHPLVPQADRRSRERNRRVEFFIQSQAPTRSP
jgi:outer membrane protein OmpA-like peptidoglycan-associated protein